MSGLTIWLLATLRESDPRGQDRRCSVRHAYAGSLVRHATLQLWYRGSRVQGLRGSGIIIVECVNELRCSGEGQRRQMLRQREQCGQRQRMHKPVKGSWCEGSVRYDMEGPRVGQASQGHEGCA